LILRKRRLSNTFEETIAQEEKGILDHASDAEEAAAELTEVLEWLRAETENITAKVNKHSASLSRINAKSVRANDFKRLTLLLASDMNTFSKRTEDLLPRFEQSVRLLDESYSALVSVANPQSTVDIEEISTLRGSLANLLPKVADAKQSVTKFRDSTLSLRASSPTKVLKPAAMRQGETLNSVVGNIEQVESFALRVTFQIDERFGTSSDGETQ
jgi:hypothetical protein